MSKLCFPVLQKRPDPLQQKLFAQRMSRGNSSWNHDKNALYLTTEDPTNITKSFAPGKICFGNSLGEDGSHQVVALNRRFRIDNWAILNHAAQVL